MAIPRPVRVSLTAACVVLFATTALAQFPKFKVPKLPSAPSVPGTKPSDTAHKGNYCDGITADEIDRFLKAMNAEQAALDREAAAARAKKAEADAKQAEADRARQARGQQVVMDMMKVADCKDPIKDKDPRRKEADRLQKLSDDASARGDEKKAEEYSKQASAISDQIDIDADRACGGKGSSLMADCSAQFNAGDPRTAEIDRLRHQAEDAGRHGDKKTSDALNAQASQTAALRDMDAHNTCLPKMMAAQMGTGAEEEQRASNTASSDMRGAGSTAQKEGAQTGGFTEDQYARLKECITGRLSMPAGMPMDQTSAAAIDARKAELKKALKVE